MAEPYQPAFKEGMRVVHTQLGPGTVLESTVHHEESVTVQFDSSLTKTILAWALHPEGADYESDPQPRPLLLIPPLEKYEGVPPPLTSWSTPEKPTITDATSHIMGLFDSIRDTLPNHIRDCAHEVQRVLYPEGTSPSEDDAVFNATLQILYAAEALLRVGEQGFTIADNIDNSVRRLSEELRRLDTQPQFTFGILFPLW
jgi:hypothetical protein